MHDRPRLTRGNHDEPAPQRADTGSELFSDLFGRFWDSTVSEDETEHQIGVIERQLRLAPGDRVLVLPAGCGRLALALAARGYKVLGIDHCPVAVERCVMLAARHGSPAEFRRHDLADPDQYRVAAALCLGWAGLVTELATRLKTALLTNGRALIEIGATASGSELTRALADAGMVSLGNCPDLWVPDGGPARRAIIAVRS